MSGPEYKLVPVGQWPMVWGTGRMFDNEKALLVSMDRKPTDDELRAFDDCIKGRGMPNRDMDELIAELCKPGTSIADIRRARNALAAPSPPIDPMEVIRVAREALERVGPTIAVWLEYPHGQINLQPSDLAGLHEALRQIKELMGEK